MGLSHIRFFFLLVIMQIGDPFLGDDAIMVEVVEGRDDLCGT